MGKVEGVKFIEKGKRIDGRKSDEIRQIDIKMGVIPNANGSAQVAFGDTIAVVGVYGPRMLYPRHLQESGRAVVRVRYNMAPFSVDDRARPGPSRREMEISKVIRLALEPALFLDNYPKTVVDVFIEIIQADGSTRCAGINAASLALADAGLPMRDLVVGLSGGKIDDTLIIDLNGLEDNNSQADIPLAFLPSKDEITLLQMDGLVTDKEFSQIIKNIMKEGKKVYEKQKDALLLKYKE